MKSSLERLQAYWQRNAAIWITLLLVIGLLLYKPGIVISILVLSLVVLVHEYGHYFVMRRNGITVTEFSIGFGRTLWSTKLKSGTVFSLKPILLGGQAVPVAEGPGSFATATRWVRFKVAMAGMFFNSLAAFVTLTAIVYVTGRMPAILWPYVSWAPHWMIPVLVGLLGSFGIWLATPVLVVWLLCTSLATFFAGSAGPIGIIAMGSQAAAPGMTLAQMVLKYAMFFYMLNSAVAGCNLLPLTPLDGSYIPTLLLDKFGGKHAAALVRGYRIVSGVILAALIIAIFGSDILKLALGQAFPKF